MVRDLILSKGSDTVVVEAGVGVVVKFGVVVELLRLVLTVLSDVVVLKLVLVFVDFLGDGESVWCCSYVFCTFSVVHIVLDFCFLFNFLVEVSQY